MKKWLPIILIFLVVVVALYIISEAGLFKTMKAADLKDSIEITDVETKWTDKLYQPWPPKLILVPAISFRVKNVSDEPLKYINFNANFRFIADNENLGDAFMAAIRGEPIESGEKSEVITLKSNYGVEGDSLSHFEDNPAWGVVECHLFASSRGSQFVKMGEYVISRTIDFEEPAEVDIKKKKEDEDKDEKNKAEKKLP